VNLKSVNAIIDSNYSATQDIIYKFLLWAEKENFKSYDPWDIWNNKLGSFTRSLYFRNKYLSYPFLLILYFLDIFFPQVRKIFTQPKIYPISQAQMGLGYLNLWKTTANEQYLIRGIELGGSLLKMSSSQITGLGWGVPFNWLTPFGLIPANTPCHTQTAYPYELFIRLYEITGENKYLDYLLQIANSVASDFYEVEEENMIASSYSISDKIIVINANSYRAFMLIEAGLRFKNSSYVSKGKATLNYIISKQNENGSWPYSEKSRFIDNYHTCFVLKNLIKIKKLLADPFDNLEESIKKGTEFFLGNLMSKKGYPRPFAVKSHISLHRLGSYDLAETIGILNEIDDDKEILNRLLIFTKAKFQSSEGWFAYRKYSFPVGMGIPYMRYANSAIFLSLTNVMMLQYLNNNNNIA
jgi:hypothetical protein